MAEAASEGATIFLSSHILSEVERIADSAVVIRTGEIVADGPIGDLRRGAAQEFRVAFSDRSPSAGELRRLEGCRGVEAEIPGKMRIEWVGPPGPLLELLSRYGITAIAASPNLILKPHSSPIIQRQKQSEPPAHKGEAEIPVNREVFARAFGSLKRSGSIWTGLLVLFAGSVIVLWPSMSGSGSLDTMMDGLSPELLVAFGLEDYGSAVGFLNGNLYAVFLPSLLAVMAITHTNSLTAGDGGTSGIAYGAPGEPHTDLSQQVCGSCHVAGHRFHGRGARGGAGRPCRGHVP